MPADLMQLKEACQTQPLEAANWLAYGLATAEALRDVDKAYDETLAIFSRGLSYQPFDPALRLQRGRKYIASGRYSQTLADITLACRLKPGDWENWYYLSVAYNLDRQYEKSAENFEECARQVPDKAGLYPVVDWLFTTYTSLREPEKAKKALALIDTSVPASTMDYSYRKRVQLFKGEISPEGFVDLAEIERSCLKTPDRPKLEVVSQLYGLSSYWAFQGEMEKSNAVLMELLEQPLFHNAFGYIKGTMDAQDRGLI